MDPNQIRAQVTARAWKDKEFKRRLLSNPKAVLEKEYNVKLPANVEFKVLEETSTAAYLTLPMQPDDVAPDQLSDAELENVAGGAASSTDVRSGCICCSVPCPKTTTNW